MLTEQDYRDVLNNLRFVVPLEPHTRIGGAPLRHVNRRFVGIIRRQSSSKDAFWPTLYWNRSGDLYYFATAVRDRNNFQIEFWTPVPRDHVLPHDREKTPCFVPRVATRNGLKMALESLFLAQPNW